MSMTLSAYSTALTSMTDAFTRFDRAGANLVQATAGVSDASPERAVVEMIGAEVHLKASVATMRSLDEMMGALLDIRV